MGTDLKPFWSRWFDLDWRFGLLLVLGVCIPRFLLVLAANASGHYGAIGLIMLISAMAPFVFLTRQGRKNIGIKRPGNYWALLPAFLVGLIASIVLYFLGEGLYGSSYDNWFTYIGRSYNIPIGINGNDKFILFWVMALTGMTVSPVGEELFFRGIVHSSFETSMGASRASLVDSSAFALTHISHFGIVFINGQWDFLTIPTIIWVASMFLVSLLFFVFRSRTGSLLGAIVCHSAFNLGMIYCIFYPL